MNSLVVSLLGGTFFVLLLTGALRSTLTGWFRDWTPQEFFIRNGNVGFIVGSLSVLTNWMQTPAFMASAFLAYTSPYHFTAFFVGNVLALILKGCLAPAIHRVNPDGRTTGAVAGNAFGDGTRLLFDISQSVVVMVMVVYTISGLQQLIVPAWGVNFWVVWGILSVIAIVISTSRGIANILNFNMVKAAFILAGIVGIEYLSSVYPTPSTFSTLPADMMSWNWTVLLGLGTVLAVSLSGGPIMNADLSQLVRVVSPNYIRWVYFTAAGLFAYCLVEYGHLGDIAKSLGLKVDGAYNPAAYQVLTHYGTRLVSDGIIAQADELVKMVTLAFLFVIMTTFASQLDGAGNLLGNEAEHFLKRHRISGNTVVWIGRGGAVIPVLAGVAIAITNPDLTFILTNLAIVRGPFILPYVASLFHSGRVAPLSVNIGIVVAVVGSICITYGLMPGGLSAMQKMPWQAAGALWAFFVPLVFMVLWPMPSKRASATIPR
jgi:Na+/proline symporter